jgi:quinol-cytochrome oxidoreductase complex cytochrome b subunit
MSRYVVEPDSDATRTPKRVALIRRETPARLLADRGEVVATVPHLLLREVILFQVCVIFLAVLALAFDAPLEGIADPHHTPNPAKAAWYFLGLQELLHYFPPVVAGVLIPVLVILALIVIPYVRVNWEIVGFYDQPWRSRLVGITVVVVLGSLMLALFHAWPVVIPTLAVYALLVLPAVPLLPENLRRRIGSVPLSDWIMTWFVTETVVLTVIGLFFRGPGWGWVLPWRDGLF